MRPVALVLALVLAGGCGGKQVATRQLAVGAVAVVALVLIITITADKEDKTPLPTVTTKP